MQWRKSSRVILLALILSTLAGCNIRTYPGPALAKNEVALLKNHTVDQIYPTRIDGKKIPFETFFSPDFNWVELLPGKHTVAWCLSYPWGFMYETTGKDITGGLNIEYSNQYITGTISFTAQAGHKYRLKYEKQNIPRGPGGMLSLDPSLPLYRIKKVYIADITDQ